ncbi:MAG: delta-aminolevulinic acid dehydratase [Actinobacteria bacterium]|nr:delta-aminolevulinic acid dehydratase [Actinomycetota bacterium]
MLRIPKGYNPVTLAFVLEASAYRALAEPERQVEHHARAAQCVSELERLQTAGYHGACWGYDFDWESRYGRLPSGTPTVVATGLVTNALFVAYRLLGLDRAFDLCASAARFVIEDLPRLPGKGGDFCWAYYPTDHQQVLNATLKGARLCVQVHSVTNQESLLDAARSTATFVARQQRTDGSWPYAVSDRRSWIDNFHTAYVLDAFNAYQQLTKDERFRVVMDKGWHFYRANFFFDDRIPKYYSHAAFPVDATACAQSLLTLCRFGDVATAANVAEWTINNMQCDDGHFAYQCRRRRLVRIPYMRWSSAYMYLGLSRLSFALTGHSEAL